MNAQPFVFVVSVLMILLWAYASISKIFNLSRFKSGMESQAFPKWVGKILFWTLPPVELGLIILLVLPETRLLGLYLSTLLMAIFTIYIGGAVYQFYERYPCPCGGVFRGMGWKRHFKVNLLLTFISLVGVLLMEFGG